MKNFPTKKFISLMIVSMIIVTITLPTTLRASQTTINLGTTNGFVILAGSSITNIGTTTIIGNVGDDIGISPGISIDSGILLDENKQHKNDNRSSIAKTDLTVAYNDAIKISPVTIIDRELGGKTLTPGIYTSSSGTFEINGALILDAGGDPNGEFIFKTSTTLNTAPNSAVSIINGTGFNKIFWQVGSSATLGANSNFVGQILAMVTINAGTGATIQGQLLARIGAVNLDSNTITTIINDTPEAVSSNAEPANITPWYNFLLFGFCIVLTGGLVLYIYKRIRV